MTDLPPCRWRGPATPQDRFPCGSPRLHVGPDGVAPETCLRCGVVDHAPGASGALPPATPPSVAAQAGTFVAEMTRWVAAGRPRVTGAQLAERKAICDACEHKRMEDGRERCGLCGCYMHATSWLWGTMETPGKLEMSTTECPVGKWKSLV